jgi:uncharacterized protein (DUF736 family)
MSDQTYNNELRGSLFKNDRKEKDTHPDYTGSCQIDNTEYYVNAWVKTSKSGQKYFSMSYKAKDVQPQPSAPNVPANMNDVDDDLPF